MLGPAVTPADAAPGSTSPGGGLQSLAVLARDSKTLIKAAEALGVTGGCMRGVPEGAGTNTERQWVKSDAPSTPRNG